MSGDQSFRRVAAGQAAAGAPGHDRHGSRAPAAALREARGYDRHTRVKSVGESDLHLF